MGVILQIDEGNILQQMQIDKLKMKDMFIRASNVYAEVRRKISPAK